MKREVPILGLALLAAICSTYTAYKMNASAPHVSLCELSGTMHKPDGSEWPIKVQESQLPGESNAEWAKRCREKLEAQVAEALRAGYK